MATINIFSGWLVACLVVLMNASIAPAAELQQPIDFSNAAYIQTGADTSIPYAALAFCQRVPSGCPRTKLVQPAVVLTEALWQQLLKVNSYFNVTIKPETDQQQYGVADYWTYPDTGYGDCEDYQLGKQRALEQLGWPASDLLMTVVRDQNGDGHAVLLVRTDRGDLILDNETSIIKLWSQTPYEFVKRQSQSDSVQWVSLIDTRQVVILASK